MPAVEGLEARKERGAFFTPTPLVSFVVDWAVRTPRDVVLEPSCGDAGFLVQAGRRLELLGAGSHVRLAGVEIHAPSARRAVARLEDEGLRAQIKVGNFFDHAPPDRYDAVVGNPPYVRYQQFSGPARAKALRAALRHGVRLNGLASSWAAFVVHAAECLKPDGRLGLVLPAELLAVKYAAPIRRYLLRRFASVRLVLFEELVFPGVLEEVVLLLAEGSGGAPALEVLQARDSADLGALSPQAWRSYAPLPNEKWTPALLPPDALDVYARAASHGFAQLKDWGTTYLGVVTGENGFFTLNARQGRGLSDRDLLRICPPGSRHLDGLSFGVKDWRRLMQAGASGLLFQPREPLSGPARAHVARGRKHGVDQNYKCRVRQPWWRVPLVSIPDLLLTYMDEQRPRVIANHARVLHLNSLYGVALRPGVRRIGKRLLPIACLNSLTQLGAEVVGRSYGGGLLKLEPREADLLPVPSAKLIQAASAALSRRKAQVSRALRERRLGEAVDLVDAAVLRDALGLSAEELAIVRSARDLLYSRRAARGKGTRGTDRHSNRGSTQDAAAQAAGHGKASREEEILGRGLARGGPRPRRRTP